MFGQASKPAAPRIQGRRLVQAGHQRRSMASSIGSHSSDYSQVVIARSKRSVLAGHECYSQVEVGATHSVTGSCNGGRVVRCDYIGESEAVVTVHSAGPWVPANSRFSCASRRMLPLVSCMKGELVPNVTATPLVTLPLTVQRCLVNVLIVVLIDRCVRIWLPGATIARLEGTTTRNPCVAIVPGQNWLRTNSDQQQRRVHESSFGRGSKQRS